MKLRDVTDDFRDEIKAKHEGTELHQVTADDLDELILVKAPTRHEYKRFKDLAAKGKEDKATLALIADCLVYPAGKEWDALLDELPGLPETISGVVLNLAGVYQNAEAKKF